MKITRMDVKGFGRFRQALFLPGPGLNLVHGPNEAGKSTLLAYVGAMLYGLRGGRRGRDGELPPLRQYEPWQGEVYAGVLEYRLDDDSTYRIGRNFLKGSTHVQDGHANDITGLFPLDRETGPQFAEAHLGMNAETFLRTLFVGQMKTALDPSGRRDVMDSLLRMQDAGRDEKTFRQAEDALQKALLERVGSGRSTVRPMDLVRNRLAELDAEAASIRRQRELVRETAMSLAETKARLSTLRSRQGSCRLELATCRKAVREGERLERLDAIRDGKDRLESLSGEEATLTAESEDLAVRLSERSALASIEEASAAQLPFDLGRRRELLRASARIELELSRKKEEAESLESELPDAPAWRDRKRVDAVLREYLALRGQVGSSDERGSVIHEMKRRKENAGAYPENAGRPGPRFLRFIARCFSFQAVRCGVNNWPIRILGSLAGAVLSISAGSLALGMVRPDIVPPRSLAGVLLVLVAGLSGIASLWVLIGPRLMGTRIAESDELGDADRDGILRWNRARKAFDTLINETGVSSVQEFLRVKGIVDMVDTRLADLARDAAELSERRDKSRSEADALSLRTSALMQAAGLTEEDNLDAGRMKDFQDILQRYRDDRNRAAVVNMRLEAILNERTALLRSVGALEENEMVWGHDLSPDSLPPEEHTFPFGHRVDLPETGDMRRKLLNEAATSAMRVPALMDSIEQLGLEIAAAQLTEATLETRLERAPTEDRLQQVIEESDRLEARQATLQAYGEGLRLALEVLRESASALRQGVSPRLDEMTGDILSAFTSGRYSRVGTDDQLSVRLEAAESAEMTALSQMSGGTADQVWLAVRLAAVRLLEEGRESLPLFLDEPFAQFDEGRTAAALRWLRDQAGKRQIFLFTCRNREKELAMSIFGDSVSLHEL